MSDNSDKLLFCEQIQRTNLNSASEMKEKGRKYLLKRVNINAHSE